MATDRHPKIIVEVSLSDEGQGYGGAEVAKASIELPAPEYAPAIAARVLSAFAYHVAGIAEPRPRQIIDLEGSRIPDLAGTSIDTRDLRLENLDRAQAGETTPASALDDVMPTSPEMDKADAAGVEDLPF